MPIRARAISITPTRRYQQQPVENVVGEIQMECVLRIHQAFSFEAYTVADAIVIVAMMQTTRCISTAHSTTCVLSLALLTTPKLLQILLVLGRYLVNSFLPNPGCEKGTVGT